MADKVTASTSLNSLKWAIALALVGVGVWGNIFFAEQPFLYRVLALVIIVAISCYIVLQTSQGAGFMVLFNGMRQEIRKVIWPTRQETLQTTLIVLVVVAIIALLLWLFDSIFSWLIGLLVG